MKAIEFKARKPGDYVETSIAPMNRTQESHFGLVDVVLIVGFLLCSCGLLCLILFQ